MAFKFEALGPKRKADEGPGVDKKPRVDMIAGKNYLQMYRFRPTTKKPLTIDTFEDATLKRMKLLTKLYELDGHKSGEGFADAAKTIVQQPEFQFDSSEDYDEDCVSHYALRLGLCVSERWRQWFVKYELLLFRLRVGTLTASEQQELLTLNDIKVEQVPDQVYQALRSELRLVMDVDDRNVAEEKYYMVPFQRVLKLVERRKVLVRKGQAFVPHRHALQLLENSYRALLMAEMNKAVKARVDLEPSERDRILAFLDHVLENVDSGTRASVDTLDLGVKLDRRQVHEVAQAHFPLCMRHLDERLRDDHHLKFHGRWQYGLFVKQLGLTLEEALEFWKSEMSQSGKKVTAESWAKSRYAYNIRHYYGAEGKRTSYTAPSCQKIIMGPGPAPEQYHGCPFRHWNETLLRRELSKPRPHPATKPGQAAVFSSMVEVAPANVEEIVRKAKDGFYTAACHQYFVHTHPGTYDASLFWSPVQYYAASRKYTEEKTGAAEGPRPSTSAPGQEGHADAAAPQ